VIQVLTRDANAPLSEPKMAASAEVVAGSRDPPINIIQAFPQNANYLQCSNLTPKHHNNRVSKLTQIKTQEWSFSSVPLVEFGSR
jgi:hypothetical protein